MMDPRPSPIENTMMEVEASASPDLPEKSSNEDCTEDNISAGITATATTEEPSALIDMEKQTSKANVAANFPKQIGNAWGVAIASNPVDVDSSSQSQPADNTTNNKKRPNVAFESTTGTSPDSKMNDNILSKPKFADIMSQQESEKMPEIISRTKVSFCKEVESEEERMMRLAIEASLQDQKQDVNQSAQKMPASALRNSFAGADNRKSAFFPTDSPHTQIEPFSSNNVAYDDDGMDDDMRMAIALSLQEAGGSNGNNYASAAVAGSYDEKFIAEDEKMGGVEDEDDRKPSALSNKVDSTELMDEDESKPAAVEKGSFTGHEIGTESNHTPSFYSEAASAMGACSDLTPNTAFAASSTASAKASASDLACTSAFAAASSKPSPPNDESEHLAQSLHEAELAEYNASRSATADAEAASLQLAMQLQQEEDARNDLQQDAEAARLKREDMCHGCGGGSVGVRTVGREEFNSLKTDKEHGDGRMVDRRRQEEMGMGKLLSSKDCYESDMGDGTQGDYDTETGDYYYYSNDRFKGDGMEQDYDLGVEEGDDGIRMNAQSTSSKWKRLDKHSFIGPNNEIRTKHDSELKHRSNAKDLLGIHGAKIKDIYNHSGASSGNKTFVSDRAYNAYKRAESRQSGFKKGVAKQGHGRAENMNAGKTRGGAMDGNVRLQISAAINAGLIDNCNGVVKEGKEALVYHADGGWKGRQALTEEQSVSPSPGEPREFVGSDGYDVAVKVFKRVVEFKGRGSYVDGDSRYHKQKFKTNDQREQVVLWAEKEYRNLIRAHRAGVPVPKPLHQKENILFMRFLGEGGWPSPQLKEIDIKKGSKKWTTFYCQTLAAIRRLYHCARLVHADLSEYNLLICPVWQASPGNLSTPDERTVDDETLQVVFIDFGQAVEVGHPSAAEWLNRDLSTVRDFFVKQGIKTLSNEDAEEFVTNPFEAEAEAEGNDDLREDMNESQEDSKETGATHGTGGGMTWRHAKQGWDDTKYIDVLLQKLKGSTALSEMKKAP